MSDIKSDTVDHETRVAVRECVSVSFESLVIQAMNNPLRRRPLLLLLPLMACAPSHHRVRLASATDLPGTADSVDRGSASVVVKVCSRACRVPGQSSQCSSVCGVWPHLGQLGRGSELCCPSDVCMPEDCCCWW